MNYTLDFNLILYKTYCLDNKDKTIINKCLLLISTNGQSNRMFVLDSNVYLDVFFHIAIVTSSVLYVAKYQQHLQTC